MRVIFKAGMLIFITESEAEAHSFAAWREGMRGHVFNFDGGSEKGGVFHDIGPREEACRTPLNIVFDQCKPQWQPISNLALTPFTMRGMSYSSVEGFWQGLKFEMAEDRERVAQLSGVAAKRAPAGRPEIPTFTFDGDVYATGSHGHRTLMLQACRAKFAQNPEARAALIATKDRLLVHRTRRDSRTIPGALLADMWMSIRAGLRDGPCEGHAGEDPKRPDGRILFFARDREDFGFLSHFHPSPIFIDGENWPTVEHYYQAQKSFDPAYRRAIRMCATPGKAKQTAAVPQSPAIPTTSWFARHGRVPRQDWASVKLDIMRRADWAKYEQNEGLAAKLLATKNAELVEDAASEPFWGTGRDGHGLNWAGRILMEVRDQLRQRPASRPDD